MIVFADTLSGAFLLVLAGLFLGCALRKLLDFVDAKYGFGVGITVGAVLVLGSVVFLVVVSWL